MPESLEDKRGRAAAIKPPKRNARATPPKTKAKKTTATARTKSARAGTAARVEAVVVRARAARDTNAQRARGIIAEIRQLLGTVAQTSHRIGVLLTQLSDPPLYGTLGYDSFKALLRGEDLMSAAHASRLMLVAATYTPATLRKLGVSKAYALVTYVETTPAADVAHILAENDHPIDGKPISKASVRHIVKATKQAELRNRARRTSSKDPVAIAKQKLAEIEQALRKANIEPLTLTLELKQNRYYLHLTAPLDQAHQALA
jgi:hypothetical protein